MPGRDRPRLLILGGTGEALALARAAVDALAGRIEVITSLAGRTRAPARVVGNLRVGGFGGADGLIRYLAEAGIDFVVDATHPFATTISANAREACERADVPRLALLRPPWRRRRGDRWIEVENAAQAATEAGRHGRRAFITLGQRDLHHFADLDGVTCLARLIETPTAPPPPGDCRIVTGRGPFTLASERRLLADHRIDVVVSKASGGRATRAKITAARERGIPVVMIRRPPAPEGARVTTVAAVLAWIDLNLS